MFINVLMYWYSHLHCAVLWNSVIGESFLVKCGVRQGGVLSPYLFSIYVDDVISVLKNSGTGIFVRNIYTGCILYATAQRVFFCCRAATPVCKKMVDICTQYGIQWEIKFNSTKSQCLSFGGYQPTTFTLILNEQVVH